MSAASGPHAHTPVVDRALALVCTLPAAEHAQRGVDVQSALSRATAQRELEDGVLLVFDNSDDTARLLLDLVLAERRCCAQFTYALSFGADYRPIELRVSAADALVQPLKDLYFGLMPVRT